MPSIKEYTISVPDSKLVQLRAKLENTDFLSDLDEEDGNMALHYQTSLFLAYFRTQLKYRYLWIDAFCIIQDDAQD